MGGERVGGNVDILGKSEIGGRGNSKKALMYLQHQKDAFFSI